MIKTIKYPARESWKTLIQRPMVDLTTLNPVVRRVFQEIQQQGDAAVAKYTLTFDKVALEDFCVNEEEVGTAIGLVPETLKAAIERAYDNIYKFHESQNGAVEQINTCPGVTCWRESRAIEKVGLYIPGGTAPLFSTVLMLGIPAKIAGCREVILCTPPDTSGKISPAIIFAAKLAGITAIYKIGGIQAIATMTLGTESVSKVDKIFGPGNQYVMAAKQLAQNYQVAIDLPAGPSEVLVIADESCEPAFVAADLLSQAEHGPDSQVVLLVSSVSLSEKIVAELYAQLTLIPRKDIAEKALENSKAIVLENHDDCMAFSNAYAPEHLIIATKNAKELAQKVSNAGSVFIGNYSCESAGDYASGTNHTLPTNGFARAYSGVSLDSFVKKITFQEISREGIISLGKTIETMAAAEQLEAHKNALSIRLKQINELS